MRLFEWGRGRGIRPDIPYEQRGGVQVLYGAGRLPSGGVGPSPHGQKGRIIAKELAAEWKEHLISSDYCPGTINTMLVSLNRFFGFLGWNDCQVKTASHPAAAVPGGLQGVDPGGVPAPDRCGTVYGQRAAHALDGDHLLHGDPGQRSEVYHRGSAQNWGRRRFPLKGKIRTILLPNKLCRKLLKYAKKQRTASGEVFLTRNGTDCPENRSGRR